MTRKPDERYGAPEGAYRPTADDGTPWPESAAGQRIVNTLIICGVAGLAIIVAKLIGLLP